MILFINDLNDLITFWCKPLFTSQCPLTVPKLSLNCIYVFLSKIKQLAYLIVLADSIIYRSSRSQMFFKVSVPKNFADFIGTHMCVGVSF